MANKNFICVDLNFVKKCLNQIIFGKTLYKYKALSNSFRSLYFDIFKKDQKEFSVNFMNQKIKSFRFNNENIYNSYNLRKIYYIQRNYFSSNFNRNKYLNFDGNNIIKEKENEKKNSKSKIKNLHKDLFEDNRQTSLINIQKSFYFTYFILNSPLIISSIICGILNLDLENFNQLSRIILNSQLLNHLFFSGILISALYKSTVAEYMSKNNIINILKSKDIMGNEEINKIRINYIFKLLISIFPGFLNFLSTHILLNVVCLNYYSFSIASSGIVISYILAFLLLKFFKMDKHLGFFKNWNILISLNILFLVIFFYIIYKRLKEVYDDENKILISDQQPFKIKYDLNRIENLKKFEEVLKDEEFKFDNDNQDLFFAIYDEIENITDNQKQKQLISKLDNIFEEN